MSKLLVKRQQKKEGGLINQSGSAIETRNTIDNAITQYSLLDYDQWNNVLAKRFAMMHKNFRKFSIKFLGVDPNLIVDLLEKPAEEDKFVLEVAKAIESIPT